MERVSQESVEFAAKVYGWVKIPHKDMLSFRRKKTRINIWFDKWGTLTVGTALEHPIQGKTQLFRKKVSSALLEAIFDNPRVHTKKGYKTRLSTNSRRWS